MKFHSLVTFLPVSLRDHVCSVGAAGCHDSISRVSRELWGIPRRTAADAGGDADDEDGVAEGRFRCVAVSGVFAGGMVGVGVVAVEQCGDEVQGWELVRVWEGGIRNGYV